MHFLRVLLSAALAITPAVLAVEQPFRLHSFNIRYAASASGNERPWSTRGPLVIQQLSQSSSAAPASAISLIGLQEALVAQLNDIKRGLGANWTHIGVGRDDGVQAGEFSPILYRTDVLRLVNFTNKWLSPTPNVPSFGWGAGSRRVVTVGVFEVIGGSSAGKRFIAANTHLDNVSSQARSEGVRVILETIRAVQAAYGPLGVSLTGDFNSEPGQDAYKAAVESGYLKDVYTLATAAQRFGPYETWTGFTSTTVKSRIDFLWLGPAAESSRWKVNRYEVVDNIVGGVYASDHRMVFADVTQTL